ncbi:type 1 fimbrial protein [Enterobacteriaceae bacterium 4M9]|nr:type 1 fimbrial protein [Enterobacteriaceae bacterium 4M9]
MRLRMMSLVFAAAVPLSAPVWAAGEIQGGEITFTGTVVGLPCLIETESENFDVPFGQIGLRDLYGAGSTRATPVPFSIKLKDCTTAVSNAVTVTFGGMANASMAEYLAVDVTSEAKGIAIGIQEASGGDLIPLNQASAPQEITGLTAELKYEAFVQGEDAALADRTITTGNFTATASYTLNYQ